MLEAQFYAANAKAKGAYTLPAEFDGVVKEGALYHAVRAHRNNQRQGTHATKTRAEVSGGSRKPWRQKGTGRARQGSTRAPNWVGGGIAFGPQPRSYRTDLPRKVRHLGTQRGHEEAQRVVRVEAQLEGAGAVVLPRRLHLLPGVRPAHDVEVFPHPADGLVVRGTVPRGQGGVGAPDPQDEAAAGQLVEGGGQVRRGDGAAGEDVIHRRAQLDAAGAGRDGREDHHRVAAVGLPLPDPPEPLLLRHGGRLQDPGRRHVPRRIELDVNLHRSLPLPRLSSANGGIAASPRLSIRVLDTRGTL